MESHKRVSRSQIIAASLRSLATLTPATSFLAQAWAETEGILRNRRIDAFLEEIGKQFTLHAAALRRVEDCVKGSPEFADLIERTVRNVARESSEPKRQATAAAFVHCILAGKRLSYEDKRRLLESLDSLLDAEVDLLRQINRTHAVVKLAHFLDMQTQLAPVNSAAVAEGVGTVVARIAKLESRGLIGEFGPISGPKIPKNIPPWAWKHMEKSYAVISDGRKLLAAIGS